MNLIQRNSLRSQPVGIELDQLLKKKEFPSGYALPFLLHLSCLQRKERLVYQGLIQAHVLMRLYYFQ